MSNGISFIISSYERPLQLLTCITSILAQTTKPTEIIIIDNSNIEENIQTIKQFTHLRPETIKYINTKGLVPDKFRLGPYDVSNVVGVPEATGNWLCFPNDDSYYVPGFSEYMIGAALEYSWDFVYCDMIYDPRHNGNMYSVVPGRLRPRYITKSSFIIKKELFNGFPWHETDWRDYALAKEINERGIKHGCASGILHFSN